MCVCSLDFYLVGKYNNKAEVMDPANNSPIQF